ncbi:uncharacterized protein [Triticum aestivum]|uniref:uncharacterized protein n=1 Tax=Triticum aestivum TaxID=4565 RepID=UPI001D03144B|nr:uncharacterized protein LOC123041051 [Triticum aestivum]
MPVPLCLAPIQGGEELLPFVLRWRPAPLHRSSAAADDLLQQDRSPSAPLGFSSLSPCRSPISNYSLSLSVLEALPWKPAPKLAGSSPPAPQTPGTGSPPSDLADLGRPSPSPRFPSRHRPPCLAAASLILWFGRTMLPPRVDPWSRSSWAASREGPAASRLRSNLVPRPSIACPASSSPSGLSPWIR